MERTSKTMEQLSRMMEQKSPIVEQTPPVIDKPVCKRRVCSRKCPCSLGLLDKLTFEAAELLTQGNIYERILRSRVRSHTRTRYADVTLARPSSRSHVSYGGTYNWKEMLKEACKPRCGQSHSWNEAKFSYEEPSARQKCGKKELWTLWMLYHHMMRMERANDEGAFKEYYFQDVF